MQVTIEDLRKVIAFSDLPDEHLQWILDHSSYHEYEDGTVLTKTGQPIDWMWIMLQGRVNFYMDVNGKLVYYFSFENDPTTGGVGGMLPYSRMKGSPGYAYTDGNMQGLQLHKSHFHELEQLNPDLIQRLIGYMTERARAFATTKLQHEKVNALGKLAAGIAHELNNPASAIDRISSELIKRLKRNFGLTEKLLAHKISAEHVQNIQRMVDDKEKKSGNETKLSLTKRIQLEEEITDWLEQKGLIGNHIAGETFAEAGFTGEDLEKIIGNVGNEPFIHVLHWLENLLGSQRVIKDLEEASARISNLVGAIKSHVHMDRTNELQPTNIQNDIENTITLLGYKLREKNITVKRNYKEDLPAVPAYVGELNQVWTNIIDNAIYAMDKNGELTIETSLSNKFAKICIIDNGSGIPPEILSRIYDPFFTTKKVGDGTGIGLDTVSRIVKHHNGEIKVDSKPGKTTFSICIPLEQKTEVA